MIDEVKFQELEDAAAHAKHNGGRVSVEWDMLDELLNTYKAANQAPESAPPQPEATQVESSEPAPPAEVEPAVPEAAEPTEPNPDDAPPVTPKPTVQ